MISKPTLTWDEVFDTKDISEKTDDELLAIGLSAWGICLAGANGVIHPNFGIVVAQIAQKLNIIGTYESFMELSRERKHHDKTN